MQDKILHNKRQGLFLIVVFFVILYGFSISGIDMRYPMLAVWYLLILLKTRMVLQINRVVLDVLIFLGVMAGYSGIIAIFNSTGDFFECFRFLRCGVTLLLIYFFITVYKIDIKQMFHILKFLFLLNALAVILCVIWPQLNYLLIPISKFDKEFLPLRSPGLTNGEDAAGFLSACGIIIEINERQTKGKGPISLVLIIFIISTAFTSRFTLLMAAFILFFDFIVLLKKKAINKVLPLVLMLVPIGILAILFWILTTGVAMEFRNNLLNSSPAIALLYDKLVSSYLDYGIFKDAVTRNITISGVDTWRLFFGSGIKASVVQDSGYVKTIYSVGIIGLLAEVFFHIKGLWKACNYKRCMPELKFYLSAYILLIVIILAWEFKYSFMFSNTVFEILMCVYLCMTQEISQKQFRNNL